SYFDSLFKRSSSDLSGWQGLINGWMMNIVAREEEAPEWFRFYTKYRFELEGFLGVQDVNAVHATPKTQQDFIDHVEPVRDQLRLNTTIFGNTEATTPVAQVEEMDVVEIGEYRCWHAKVTFECESIATKFS